MAYTDYLDDVQKGYVAYYGRPADPDGLEWWAKEADKAGGMAAVINQFGTSLEATALHAPYVGNTSALVNSLYQQLFDRDGEPAGLKYWADLIDYGTQPDGTFTGKATLAGVMWDMLNGAQNTPGEAQDLDAITNKLEAANDFTAHVNLTPEILAYAGDAAAEIARTWLATVDETAASLEAAVLTIDSTILSIEAVATPGETFTLTTDAPIITEPASGTKALTFTLTLDSAPTEAVTVDYATLLTGTATSDTDFVAATGTVTFVAGQQVATVSITVNNDITAENDETVAVQFSGTALAADVTGTGTILKNDTAGNTVVLTAGTDDHSADLTANDDTINTNAPGQLTSADTVTGGDGTDTLSITPTINVALTLDDAIFTNVTGVDKIVILTTGTGAQTITTGAEFQGAFGAAGADLQTTSSTGPMVIDMSSVTGPVTLTTTSTTGPQTITTGSGIATVTATSSTGSVSVTTGAGADVVTLTTSGDTLGTVCVITTDAGNDTITIVAAGAAAETLGNSITGGLGADTITLSSDAEKNIIVIGNADSGITVAAADRITGFDAATDDMKMGTVATNGVNYVEAGAAVANFADALTAANIALDGTVLYSFQWVVGDAGYLFKDTGVDGTADQVVVLVGIVNTTISAADIIA